MRFEPIQFSKDIIFAKEIYYNSFPKNEIRNFDLLLEMVGRKELDFFIIYSIEKETKPIGIVSLWRFKEFLFIEHFAIEKSLRNKGYGSKVITKIIQDNSLPILIEIEPPTTQKALKRIEFYKRLNFSLLDFHYIQPAYSEAQKPIELKLMVSSKKWFNSRNTQKAIREIYKKVYKIL